MIKSVFAATAALSMSAGAAFAGPYVNIEDSNASYPDGEYTGVLPPIFTLDSMKVVRVRLVTMYKAVLLSFIVSLLMTPRPNCPVRLA